MFLKFLEKLGKKRVVLDRGPSHPRYDLAKPWMNRYYLLFRNRGAEAKKPNSETHLLRGLVMKRL